MKSVFTQNWSRRSSYKWMRSSLSSATAEGYCWVRLKLQLAVQQWLRTLYSGMAHHGQTATFHICNISILLPCLNYAVCISHNYANYASSIQSCYPTVLTRGHTYWSLVRLPWKLDHSMQTWNQSKPENKWLSIPASSREASREAVDKAANCLLCEY